jgi:endonuclease G
MKRWLVISCVLFVLISCKKETPAEVSPAPPPPPPPPASQLPDNDHFLLGNPTNAVTDPLNTTNYLANRSHFKLGYHSSRGIPTWVSWHFQSEDAGSTPRQDNFRPDNLPSSFYPVTHSSYTGSGFDRGHNCPSGDRTSSVAANSATFLMTNIIPQAPTLNQGPWEGLETYMRNTLVGTTNEAYVIMGNYGTGGKGSGGEKSTIDAGRVTVPAMVWKVIVVLPKGDSDLQRLDTAATVVVVDMPNNNELYTTSSAGNNQWRNYLTTISALEQRANAAGAPLKLLENVRADVKAYLKNKRF